MCLHAVVKQMRHCSELVLLDLHGNRMLVEGVREIAGMLESWSQLAQLILGEDTNGNGFGDAGARMLAEHMKHSAQLTELDLSGHEMSAEGARAIGKQLHHCPALKTINLNRNNLVCFENGKAILCPTDVTGLFGNVANFYV